MTRDELAPQLTSKGVTWNQVYETLVNAHVPPEELALFMSGEPIRSVQALGMIRQLIASGEVPTQPML